MNEYEIVFTYLNGCAGAAYPQRSFEEVALASPDDFIREKHGKDFEKFGKEIKPGGQIVYTFKGPAVTYIYEFTKL